MATDQHPHGNRRAHFHRGRRGPDRRGDRRPQSQAAPEPSKADGIDVDQIVREIKARISQRHGIDLSPSQIQELAARRLEAILDPRGIKPSLLEQLRKSAGTPAGIAPLEPPPGYEFEDHTIFDTHNGLLRAIRKLLNPLLKLFFNPNPIAHALNTQAKLNKDAAKREQERERTQAEWNALHYTLVERLVTELARTSIEGQSLAMKVESLLARVDYYERRVRGLETTAQPVQAAAVAPSYAPAPQARPQGGGDSVTPDGGGGDSSRRRRRRRRGRRGPGGPEGVGPAPIGGGAAVAMDAADDDDVGASADVDGGDGVGTSADVDGPDGNDAEEPPAWNASPEPPPSWNAVPEPTPAVAETPAAPRDATVESAPAAGHAAPAQSAAPAGPAAPAPDGRPAGTPEGS